jgi:hypothetical protein
MVGRLRKIFGILRGKKSIRGKRRNLCEVGRGFERVDLYAL